MVLVNRSMFRAGTLRLRSPLLYFAVEDLLVINCNQRKCEPKCKYFKLIMNGILRRVSCSAFDRIIRIQSILQYALAHTFGFAFSA